MEDKKYEAGKVEISSAEYRDLVTEAVTARSDASQERSRRWEIENTLKKTQEELELTRKRVCELKSINEALRGTNTRFYNIPSDASRPLRIDETITYNHTPTKEDI